MPITKTPAFQTSDGQTWPTLALAQRAELTKLLTPEDVSDNGLIYLNTALDAIFKNLETVKAILGATGRRPRKANGAKKPRRTRTNAAVKAGGE